MSDLKYKNGVLSAVFGLTQHLITLIFGLIVPRLFIRTFGSEVNGFLTSISNLYSYLALVEAGVGTAAIQALYGPIGRDDKRGINEIMAATSAFYNRAGAIYFIGAAIIAIAYPLTVKTEVPTATIVIVTALEGLSGVLNFWIQGKYMVLLRAEGKKYLQSIVTIAVYVAQNLMKVILLNRGYDVIAITIGSFIISLLRMLVYYWYIKKNYKWLDLKVTPNKAALSQSNAVFVQQIMWTICSNTDILVLTYVAQDLKSVSVYNVYLMVFSMIEKLFSSLFGSFHYLLGQKYNTDREGYMPIHKVYEGLSMAGSFALYTIAFLLTTPFMKIYTAGITDIAYVDKYLPFLFTVMHLLAVSGEASSRVINFAGHFKQMQWRATLEAVINIVVSILLVRKIGIYGVLIGTIVAHLWRTQDIIIYANKNVLNRGCWPTYKLWLANIVTFCLCWVISTPFNLNVSGFAGFFAKAIVCGIVVCVIYLVQLRIVEKDSVDFLKKVVRNVIRKISGNNQEENCL